MAAGGGAQAMILEERKDRNWPRGADAANAVLDGNIAATTRADRAWRIVGVCMAAAERSDATDETKEAGNTTTTDTGDHAR